MNRRLGQPQNRPGRFGEEKKSLASAGIGEVLASNIDWFISYSDSFVNYSLYRRVFAQGRGRWPAVVNVVMNLRFP